MTTPSGRVFRNFLGNNFYFDRTPRWSQKVIYWISGPFWATGTQRNSGPGARNRKTQFPGARGTFGVGIRPPQKILPEIAQLFYILRFGRLDPQGREIAKCWFFRPFWPRSAPWHLEKFRAENTKRRFPGARGTFGGKYVCPKS